MEASENTLRIIIRIDWSDLDMYEHVNNVSIVRYLQSARVNFWELSGLYESYNKTNRGPMLVSSKCDFKKSLFYPGSITIESKIVEINNSSFSLEHSIFNEHGEICVVAKDVAVCYDFNLEKTYSIPGHLREFMENHSGRSNDI